ncbi:MFS transporter [Jiangella alba]|uniref:Major Facilitator Superfamily protein n=1 Tax=Jiangella alba TaxID=561176 RepID=A0A1H5KYT1_9ACTN|nr:MFS transporter [Jiangella alba]SEE69870.1 Major Facilitator Superfamily protein [Jiangella alba]
MRPAHPTGALAALCLTQIVGWGVLYYSFPVALPAITAGTGWSESSTTAAFSAALLVAAVAGIAVGRIIDRHGPRWVMTLGSVIGVAATLAVAAAPGVGWFAAAWVIAGIAQAGTLYAPAFTALTRWYGPARVRALTVLTLVAGLSSTIFAPATAALLDHLSWRQTYVALAVLLAVTTAIPGHAFGLTAPWPAADHAAHTRLRDGHVRAVATSRPFVCLTIASALTAFAMFAATIHLIPLLTGRGLSMTLAAWALGLSGAGQLLGRIGYAPLSRRTTPRVRSVLILTAVAATVAAVGLLPGPAAALVAASIVLGVARGAFTLLQSTAVSDRWGIAGFGTLYGILNAPTTIAMAVAPWAGSAIAAAVGSSPAMFAVLTAIAVAAAVVAIGTATINGAARP